MKKQILAAVVFVVSIVLSGECFARPRVLQAQVPFAFEVEGQRFPAGTYEIDSVATGNGTVQMFKQVGGNSAIRFFTITVEIRNGDNQPEFVFHRYGESYFLWQLRSGDGHALQLFPSKQELEAAQSQSPTVVALAVR
jgi:hypothetical protein